MALLEGLAAAAAKIVGASTAAKAAAGLGIAAASVTGAGATGVLPAPVQDAVAGAVETVTPLDLPDSGQEPTDDVVEPADPAVEEPAVEEPAVEEPTVEDPATEEPTGDDPVVEDPATGEQPEEGAEQPRGLENAIQHANERAQATLQANLARQQQHEAEKAARAQTDQPEVEEPETAEPESVEPAAAETATAEPAREHPGRGAGRGR